MKRYINKNNETNEISYWLSIGDLMASILIVFILLFVYKIQETQVAKDKHIDEIKRINNELIEKEAIITELTIVKNKIIKKLRNEFKKEDMKIDMDPITGDIKLDEKILFNPGQSLLKKEGKIYLKKFIPKYVNILLGDENIKKEVAQIIIEGHTDDVGNYIVNLDISQKRAFAVVWFIYTEMDYFKNKKLLKKYITANGRSKVNLVLNDDKTVNRKKSRRVVFKFRLKNEETIIKIKDELKNRIK